MSRCNREGHPAGDGISRTGPRPQLSPCAHHPDGTGGPSPWLWTDERTREHAERAPVTWCSSCAPLPAGCTESRACAAEAADPHVSSLCPRGSRLPASQPGGGT